MKKMIFLLAVTIGLACTASAELLGSFGGSDYINGGGTAIGTNLGTGAAGVWHVAGENATYTNVMGGAKYTGTGTGAANFQIRDSNTSLSDTLGFLVGVGTSAIGDQCAIAGMVAFGSSTLTNLFVDYASSGLAASYDTTARVVIVQSGVYKISDATMLPMSTTDVGNRSLTSSNLLGMNWVTWNPNGTINEFVVVNTSGGTTLANLDNVTGAGVWYGRTQTASGTGFGFGTINGILAQGTVVPTSTNPLISYLSSYTTNSVLSITNRAMPGETINAYIVLKNTGGGAAANVAAAVVAQTAGFTIGSSPASFGNIPVSGTATNSSAVTITVPLSATNGTYSFAVTNITANNLSVSNPPVGGSFTIQVITPMPGYVSTLTDGDRGNGKAELGEVLTATITLTNSAIAGVSAQDVKATVVSPNTNFLVVTGSPVSFGTISGGGRSNASVVITVSSNALPGNYIFSVTNIAGTNGGPATSGSFTVQVFQAVSASPSSFTLFAKPNDTVSSTLTVTNGSASNVLTCSFTTNSGWLSVSPSSITIQPGAASNITITAGPLPTDSVNTGLVTGIYNLPAPGYTNFTVKFIVISDPYITYESAHFVTANPGKAMPGETINAYVNLKNNGAMAYSVTASVTSVSTKFTVGTPEPGFGDIPLGATVSNTAPFTLTAVTNAKPGLYEFTVDSIGGTNAGTSVGGSFTVEVFQAVSASPATFAVEAGLNTLVTNSTLSVSNSATIPLYAYFATNQPWLTVSPAAITIAPHSASNISLIAGPLSTDSVNTGTVSAIYSLPTTNVNSFTVVFTAKGPRPALLSVLTTNLNGQSDVQPGDVLNAFITVTNNGILAQGVSATVSTTNAVFTVSNSPALFGDLAAGATASNNIPVFITVGSSTAPGAYVFDITNIAANNGGQASSGSFTVTVVKASVVPFILTNSISEISGGMLSNLYEPGETLYITVPSTNNGTLTVTDIAHTLSANSAYFTISQVSNIVNYASMAVGAVTSTTYQVIITAGTPSGNHTFIASNTAGVRGPWTNTFSLPVYNQANPSIQTNALIINVPAGGTAFGTLGMTNAGNSNTTFTISGTNAWVSYAQTPATDQLETYFGLGENPDTNYVFTSWIGDSSAPMAIGFNFPLFGQGYTNFSVSRYGAISFGGTTVGANVSALPSGTNPVIAPFWTATAAATNSIRYIKTADGRLVVSWGGTGIGDQFQTWIYTNGNIKHLYGSASRSSGAVGTQRGAHYFNATNRSGGALSGILLTPQNSTCVTNAVTGSIAPFSGQTVTFYANAVGQNAGATLTFTNTVTWNSGGSTQVVITVNVVKLNYGLTVNPTNPTFLGLSGYIVKTNALLINTGSVALAYTIVDDGNQVGYGWTNATYSWPTLLPNVFATTDVSDEGVSSLLPIGFPFQFFGNTYTQLCVGVNGGIRLGSSGAITANSSLASAPDRFIAPYWGDLYLGSGASVGCYRDADQFVVTWVNMQQLATGGSNLTFRAVLRRDGNINFQYQNLSGSNAWPNTVIGLRDTSARTVSATLSNAATTVTTITTNLIWSNTVTVTTNSWAAEVNPGQVVTNITSNSVGKVTNTVFAFKNDVVNQSIIFTNAGQLIITVEPLSGTIQVGQQSGLALIGDARNLTNGASRSTTFTISYIGGTNSFLTTMHVTNNAALFDPDLLRDWLTGTDVFLTSVAQNSGGSRTISWPAPNDFVHRTYKVFFTTNLMSGWVTPPLYSGENFYSYVDTVHTNEPVIYYKVTVQ